MHPNRSVTLKILCTWFYFSKYVIMGLGEILRYFRDNLDLSIEVYEVLQIVCLIILYLQP